MPLNPIKTTNDISQKYTDYLQSMFFVKDQDIYKQVNSILSERGKFIKGPFIEITPPFVGGASLETLISEGVISKEFYKIKDEFPIDRNLYNHQEKAIRKIASEKKNIVVATGTGSGKTECFMIPIINELMREKEEGILNDGVRALLLYPMNALVNDQLSRLRDMLKNYPEITFGRYTGETLEKEKDAIQKFKTSNPDNDILPNELLSRERMRETPPHILVTNYAMLEFLLIRPDDNVFFDGELSDNWRFIVLDEAHTYKGAKGTEISMLLKRVKERVDKGNLEIRCIATSATLGGGEDDYDLVVDFAKGLFTEPFLKDGIIESKRKDITKNLSQCVKRSNDFYLELYKLIDKNSTEKTILEDMSKNPMFYDYVDIQGSLHHVLFKILENDYFVALIHSLLIKGALDINELNNKINEHSKSDMDLGLMVIIIELSSRAKENITDMKLMPARYHLFVRALEGAFISFYPEKRIYLDRKKEIQLIDGNKASVFEFANCQSCGQEYIVGKINEEGKLIQSSFTMDIEGIINDKEEYFILKNEDDMEVDEDEALDENELYKYLEDQGKVEPYKLCTVCGTIRKSSLRSRKSCCEYKDDKFIEVWKTSSNNVCHSCGSVSRKVVRRMMSGDDASTEVLARTLYQNIPPVKQSDVSCHEINTEIPSETDPFNIFNNLISKDINNTLEVESEIGRKLLIFSDSRQEAAYFSTFLNNKYNSSLWRKTILESITQKPISIDFVVKKMIRYADEKDLFEINDKNEEKQEKAYGYLMREFMSLDKSTGLEGVGLMVANLEKPEEFNRLGEFSQYGITLSNDNLWALYCIIFNSFRQSSAVVLPEYTNYDSEYFRPKNRKEFYFSLESDNDVIKNRTILGWLPSGSANNKRLDYITKLLIKNGQEKNEAKDNGRMLLKLLFNQGILQLFKDKGILSEYRNSYRLNYKAWTINNTEKIELYRCNKCGAITQYNIEDICPNYKCNGDLISFKNQKTRLSYYREQYQNMKTIPMIAEEHTAQLTSERASELQVKFEQAKVNILSCSTTFEMGVDVGQLEAVFMRNVPPETANYIQRAGRAGRRTEATAFSLTYAKRRSHDLTFYQYPKEIISGAIKPPYIENKNEKIVARHCYSLVLSWFFHKYPHYFGTFKNFVNVETGQNGHEMLRLEINKKPQELLNSLNQILDEYLYKRMNVDEWGWVDDFIGENGVLTKAIQDTRTIIEELEVIKENNFKNGGNVDWINRLINTYNDKNIITFLAGYNVIPKYGFPVDVVELHILHNGEEAKNINLSRDLKLAISEFAPGSEIIAGGRVWKPYALKKSSNKGWPIYRYVICRECNKIYKEIWDSSSEASELPSTCCGTALRKPSKYLKPEFGFTTNNEPPNKPTESKPPRSLSSQVIFDTYDEDELSQKIVVNETVTVGGYDIDYKYSSRGRMVLVNSGYNGTGFKVCSHCGYMTNGFDLSKEHKTRIGDRCINKNFIYTDFGHDFITDVLELKMPNFMYIDIEGWRSILYAILEGASRELGIARTEINGCIYFDADTPRLVLFDEVPGGAGHVKKISSSIPAVIEKALEKVSGGCGCGPETSCYGCLRNYSNQIYHERLRRGIARDYLLSLGFLASVTV